MEAFNYIMENAEIKPQMAQIECHPRAQRTDARQLYADNYDIQVECWYPLNHNRLDVNFVDYEYDHTFTPTSVNENNETNTDTGETRIFTIDGKKVTGNGGLESLPAGLYIINGKKQVITK